MIEQAPATRSSERRIRRGTPNSGTCRLGGVMPARKRARLCQIFLSKLQLCPTAQNPLRHTSRLGVAVSLPRCRVVGRIVVDGAAKSIDALSEVVHGFIVFSEAVRNGPKPNACLTAYRDAPFTPRFPRRKWRIPEHPICKTSYNLQKKPPYQKVEGSIFKRSSEVSPHNKKLSSFNYFSITRTPSAPATTTLVAISKNSPCSTMPGRIASMSAKM